MGTWRTSYKQPKAEWTPVEKTGAAELTYRRVLGGKFVQESLHQDDHRAQREEGGGGVCGGNVLILQPPAVDKE